VHPLAGVEGGLHLKVGGEPRTLVERASVWVCGDFKPDEPFRFGNIDYVDDELPPDASPHPIWIDEDIFHLDDVTCHQPGGEPDDSSFGMEGDPCTPLCHTAVSEHEISWMRQEVISVSPIR